MTKNDRVAGLIRKLNAVTVDNGATPEEAMAAAAKARQLCDQYGLSAAGIDIEEATEAVAAAATARWTSCGRPSHGIPTVRIFATIAQTACTPIILGRPTTSPWASHRRRVAAAAFTQGMVEALCAKLYARNSKEQQQEIAAARAECDRRYALEDGPALPCVKRVRPTDSALVQGHKAGRDVTISTPISGATAPTGLLTAA